MDPEQIMNWVASLPPELQASMIQALYGMGGGQFPVNPYNAETPGVVYNYTPEMDKNGNVQPYDLTTARNNLNYVQDTQGTMVDPVFTALAGPAAYSRDAFAPTEKYGTGSPEALAQLNYYAGLDPLSTMEGFIANAMRAPNSMSASQAYAEFLAASQTSPELAAQIPKTPIFDQVTGTITGEKPDPGKIYEFATGLQNELASATPPELEDSPAAKWYKDQGLPLPTEQYGAGSYDPQLNLPPGAVENFQMADQALPQAKEAQRQRNARADAMMREVLRGAGGAGVETGPASGGTPPVDRAAMMSQQGQGTPPVDRAAMMSQQGQGTPPVDRTAMMRQLVIPQGSPPAPGMEPTTTGGRRPLQGTPGTGAIEASRLRRSGERAVDQAKRDRRAAYNEVFLNPDYLYEKNRMEGYNRAGRSPTQDALMARQMTNYLLGVYGPRG